VLVLGFAVLAWKLNRKAEGLPAAA
jgi:hypothetical protein